MTGSRCLAPRLLASAIAVIGTASAQVSEAVLHNFSPPPKGANPFAGLIRDGAGNFYGTTAGGGAYNAGAVYKFGSTGRLAVEYSFTGGTDGNGPRSGVTRDSSGNLYGTTVYGGTWGAGVIYKLDTSRNLTVLYSFTGGPDGAYPFGDVVLDSAGNLYGTTAYGGSAQGHSGNGVVFKLSNTGEFTVLHTFSGGSSDGAYPWAGVILDSALNLYGTTYFGGSGNSGVVFKIDSAGNETLLYNFSGGTDGANPQAGVIRDAVGNLYGTTFSGGAAGLGVVFKLNKSNQETPLHSFTGGTDGANPYGGVIRDSAGNLYGTTVYGGPARAGAVYKLDASGNETFLYAFSGGSDGQHPYGGVIRDSAGFLYGNTIDGGSAGLGAIFQIDSSGVQTTLYAFPESAGGFAPNAGVIRDAAGNLYGTAPQGGGHGAGVVYKVNKAGREIVLYSFTGGADGSEPNSGVIRDKAGNLYGTTFNGGTFGYGVVFQIDTSGTESVLYNFTGGSDGSNPYGGLVRDPAGNLYGTAWFGGSNGAGVIYEIAATGGETVLYSFTGSIGDSRSYGSLARDRAGNLYGTEYAGGGAGFGAVYKLYTTNSYSVLYSFTGGDDGRYPYAALIVDSQGNLYGTTEVGGPDYGGVIYEVTAGGQFSVLYSFTGDSDGDYPNGRLARDSAGNLYGTTNYGGTSGAGLVYELNTSNSLTVLYSFTGAADGANPDAGVALDNAGNLYGTTLAGGSGKVGVVFEIKGAGAVIATE